MTTATDVELPTLDAGGDQALQPPPDHAGGRHGRAAQAEGGQRALHRRRRPGLAGGDVSRRGRRRPHRHRRLRRRRLQQPAAAAAARDARTSAAPSSQSAKDSINALNPHVQVETYETALSSENALRAVQGLRRHPRRHRQLPDALPRQRRLRADGQAERLRQHLPLRGPGVGVRDQGRPVLPLPLSRAAASRARAELRRGRRAGRAAGHHRRDPGDRGDQADRSASASRSSAAS